MCARSVRLDACRVVADEEDRPPITEAPEPVVRPRPPRERPQVEALLKLQAAKLLGQPGNGRWRRITLRHACGTFVDMHVVWDRGGDRFVGKLVEGVLADLEVYEGRG